MNTEPEETQNFPSPNEASTNTRIDILCDEFEAALKAGQQPQLEDFLRRFGNGDDAMLFRSLLELLVDYGQRTGNSVDASTLRPRFSNFMTVIDDVLASQNAPTQQSEISSIDQSLEQTFISQEDDGTQPDGNCETTELPVPERLGEYHVDRVLGKGGFGYVYLARDTNGSEVAIKVLHPHLADRPDLRKQFDQEADILRKLQHPALVNFIETFETEDGLHCLVTELLSGGTLTDQLADKTRTPEQVAEFISQLAEALHRMHLNGYTHRDVKPDNILLDAQGRPKLVDVGLALEDGAYGKGARHVAGSLAYLSPEQARGDSHLVDGRTDIYSLGVVMYQLLTGRRPFVADETAELLRRIQEIAIRPPRQVNAEIPEELEAICLKATARDASDRYSTAGDFAAALQNFLSPSKRPAWKPLLAAAVLVCVVGGVIYGMRPAAPDLTTAEVDSSSVPAAVSVTDFAVYGSRDGGAFVPVEDLRRLVPGDAVRFAISLDQPAFVRLLWIDAHGEPQELYPNDPEKGMLADGPVVEVQSPIELDRGWPLEPAGGSEMAMIMVSREPFPDRIVPPLNWGDPADAELTQITRYSATRNTKATVEESRTRQTRGLGGQTQQVDDPVLQLMEHLRQQSDAVHAVRIPMAQ